MSTYPFIKQYVDAAPDREGVYFLYDGPELIYHGRALGKGVTIRSRLQDHLAGRAGKCTQSATDYGFEYPAQPDLYEVTFLAAYKKRFGRLPRCNERIG